jgi:hypothetical protein
VPQGGPDLRAEEARAHEDIAFVWFVADVVMDEDPRAWWMRHWLIGTRSIQTPEVFALEEPLLLADVLDLRPGEEAVRERVGGPWQRRPEFETP